MSVLEVRTRRGFDGDWVVVALFDGWSDRAAPSRKVPGIYLVAAFSLAAKLAGGVSGVQVVERLRVHTRDGDFVEWRELVHYRYESRGVVG